MWLLMTMRGPLASWGVETYPNSDSGFGIKTSMNPPKSAVLGMLNGALGIDLTQITQSDLVKAASEIQMLTCAACGPKRLDDYQTRSRDVFEVKREGSKILLTPKHVKTSLVTKEHLTDYHAEVALLFPDHLAGLAMECLEGLNTPLFTPYLGKASCPLSAPMRPEVLGSDLQPAAVLSRMRERLRKPLSASGKPLQRSHHKPKTLFLTADPAVRPNTAPQSARLTLMRDLPVGYLVGVEEGARPRQLMRERPVWGWEATP